MLPNRASSLHNMGMNALLSASSYRPDFSTPGYLNANGLEMIGDKTLLEHQVDALLQNGVDNVYVVLPKGSEEATRFLQTKGGVHPIFLSKPLGTGGAIALAPLDDDLLFVPGNFFFEVDIPSMLRFHREREALLTCLCRPEAHPEKKDVLTLKENGRGFIILPKETTAARDFFYSNLIPTDFAILSPDLLCTFDPEDPWPLDFRKETLEPTLAVEGLYSYFSTEYALEITNAETLAKARRDFEAGIPAQKCLKNPQKAFFLDRDGTINVFGDFVVRPDMLHLIPGAAEAINKIHDAGYLAICVTNQPVVARGECTPQEMANILANLEMLLGKEGAYLDAIYYCPHYPKEFPGSDKRFTKECRCRKPRTGLVEEATKAFNIDLSSSWFIGDTCRDVKTGQNAGTHTALLLSGDPNPGKRYGEAVPEKTYQNLKEAIDDILG